MYVCIYKIDLDVKLQSIFDVEKKYRRKRKREKGKSDKIWTRTASNRDKVRREHHGSKPLDLDISSRRKTIASVVRERDA